MALYFWREGSEGMMGGLRLLHLPMYRGKGVWFRARVMEGFPRKGGSISASTPHPQSGANRGMVHISGAHVRSFIVLIKGNI